MCGGPWSTVIFSARPEILSIFVVNNHESSGIWHSLRSATLWWIDQVYDIALIKKIRRPARSSVRCSYPTCSSRASTWPEDNRVLVTNLNRPQLFDVDLTCDDATTRRGRLKASARCKLFIRGDVLEHCHIRGSHQHKNICVYAVYRLSF